ncbi:MAG: SDR family oxidoreductase [Devosiaceae bacterium]|nr:SDR family oxidoreductase [Devosiaceae bacterium]
MKGRVILVTGSNEGIGFAIARLCHDRGAIVVLHGLDASTLKVSANNIGADVKFIAADLMDTDAPSKIIDFVIAQHGRIDGLVNNAGMLDRCTLETASAELSDRMFAVNFRAPMMLIKAAVAKMVVQGNGGSIVNIGSVNSTCGAPTLLIYSATKAALATMTRNLGASLGRDGIRINQIDVGWTVTESEHRIQAAEGQPKNWQQLIPADYQPSGALLSVKQVARHAVFWLSLESAPVNGQVIEVEQYPMIGRSFGSNWSDD